MKTAAQQEIYWKCEGYLTRAQSPSEKELSVPCKHCVWLVAYARINWKNVKPVFFSFSGESDILRG